MLIGSGEVYLQRMGAVAAAIYFARREHRILRSLGEIAEYSRASRREIARCYREMMRELRLKAPLLNPADFTPRVCEGLRLSHRVAKRTLRIAERARKLGIVKKPETIATAVVYLASWECGEPRSQRAAAAVAGVSEGALRNASGELAERLGIPVPISR